MNALCCQKVWDLSSELTWQHAFSVSSITLAANWDQNPGKITVGAYPCVYGLTALGKEYVPLEAAAAM